MSLFHTNFLPQLEQIRHSATIKDAFSAFKEGLDSYLMHNHRLFFVFAPSSMTSQGCESFTEGFDNQSFINKINEYFSNESIVEILSTHSKTSIFSYPKLDNYLQLSGILPASEEGAYFGLGVGEERALLGIFAEESELIDWQQVTMLVLAVELRCRDEHFELRNEAKSTPTIGVEYALQQLEVLTQHPPLLSYDVFPDLYFKLDKSGRMLEFSAGSKHNQLTDAQNLIGKHISEILPPEKALILADLLKRAANEESIMGFNYSLELEGGIQYFEARLIPASHQRIIGIVRNITQQKQTENQLLNAKTEAERAVKAKDKFLSVMSHEIRTPLNAVIGITHLLMREENRPESRKLLETLKFAADNLLVLTNDILDLSKMQAGELALEQIDFSLSDLLQRVFACYQSLAEDKGLRFEYEIITPVLEMVKGDPARLMQIINNLLSNAIKFTTKGSVTLTVSLHEETNTSHFINFEVKDTGIGIVKEKQALIFEEFKQADAHISRQYGGSGLGLSIIKNLVELMGGQIKVSSQAGKGTTFNVIIPFQKTNNQQKRSKRDSYGGIYAPLEHFKVLYVEDVLTNQFLLQGLSTQWQINLSLASSGSEALQLLQRQDYDLILMDLQMPEMDGYETTFIIREQLNKAIPIVALSADVSAETQSLIKDVGMDGFISKPINPEDLYKILAKFAQGVQPRSKEQETHSQELSQSTPTLVIMPYEMDFSYTDRIFAGDNEGNEFFIKISIEEFESDFPMLRKSIEQKNFKLYREVNHKFSTRLSTFRLEELTKFMKQMRHDLEHNPNAVDAVVACNEVDRHIEGIRTLLNRKLSELAMQK